MGVHRRIPQWDSQILCGMCGSSINFAHDIFIFLLSSCVRASPGSVAPIERLLSSFHMLAHLTRELLAAAASPVHRRQVWSCCRSSLLKFLSPGHSCFFCAPTVRAILLLEWSPFLCLHLAFLAELECRLSGFCFGEVSSFVKQKRFQ